MKRNSGSGYDTESRFRLSSAAPKSTVEATERVPRADAVRNRQRVLDAALAVFGELGFDAQMPEIAKRAGVGVGTLYRHFPTKADLVGALADQHFERMVELAQEAIDSGLPAWEALETFIWRAATNIADDRGMAEVMSRKRDVIDVIKPPERLVELGVELIARAQESGDVREDARVDDIPTILCGLGQVVVSGGQANPDVTIDWRRYVTLMLCGLRRQPAEPAQP
jgi:AcrR family transcriptional regulator